MTAEDIRAMCMRLPGATEDVKWGADLCFSVGGKMFCVTGLGGEFGVSFKVPDEDFEDVSQRKGFMPAPYAARHKWVRVSGAAVLSKKECERFIAVSHSLVAAKLPKRTRENLGLG